MDTMVTVDSEEIEPEGMDMETTCTEHTVVIMDTVGTEDTEVMEVTEGES